MLKSISFVLLALFCPLTPAAFGCGQPLPDVLKPTPADPNSSIEKTVMVEAVGKVVWLRCKTGDGANVGIDVGNNKFVWLDLRGNKTWHRIIGEAKENLIAVKGEMNGDVVRVTELGAAADGAKPSYKESIKVELRGLVFADGRDILRTDDMFWCIKVDGVEYFLNFKGNEKRAEKAAKLADRRVILTGTLVKIDSLNAIKVTGIDRAVVGEFKITFGRTSGLPDFRHMPDVTIDSTKLKADKVAQLRRLIETARFFDLRSSEQPPVIVPDPPAANTIKLVMGDVTHEISVADFELKPALEALLGTLKDLRVEQVARSFIGMTEGDARIRAAEFDYTVRLGGKDGVTYMLTQDYRDNRINIWVVKGKVVTVTVG